MQITETRNDSTTVVVDLSREELGEILRTALGYDKKLRDIAVYMTGDSFKIIMNFDGVVTRSAK